ALGSLAFLAVLCISVGAVAGLVVTTFRIALEQSALWRGAALSGARDLGFAGLLLTVTAIAAITSLASCLVCRFAPPASCGGIPRVQAALTDELPQVQFRVIPIKFLGGWLAIGSGLALGREGPCVQMGATLGYWIGLGCRRSLPDCRVLLAAGAGAGLA